MSPESDAGVTILGGGAVGICTALELVQRGIPVRLIDRDAPGQGASSGIAGVISPFSVVPQSMPGVWKKAPGWLLDPLGPVAVRARHLPRFLPWALRFVLNGSEARARAVSAAMDGLTAGCVDLYRRHLEGTGHEGLVRDSCYVLAHRDPALASDRGLDAELRRMAGARVEVIGADALREMEPDLSPEFRAAVVVHGQARALSPGRLMAVLAEKLRALVGAASGATWAEAAAGGGARLSRDVRRSGRDFAQFGDGYGSQIRGQQHGGRAAGRGHGGIRRPRCPARSAPRRDHRRIGAANGAGAGERGGHHMERCAPVLSRQPAGDRRDAGTSGPLRGLRAFALRVHDGAAHGEDHGGPAARGGAEYRSVPLSRGSLRIGLKPARGDATLPLTSTSRTQNDPPPQNRRPHGPYPGPLSADARHISRADAPRRRGWSAPRASELRQPGPCLCRDGRGQGHAGSASRAQSGDRDGL